jgi:transcription antitermination factor NusG
MERNWYILFTKPGQEVKMAHKLKKNGYESFCPLNRVPRQWHSAKAFVCKPLFPAYVFVKAGPHQHAALVTITGAVNLVYWQTSPVVVLQQEIDAIQHCLSAYSTLSVNKITINPYEEAHVIYPSFNEESDKEVKLVLPRLGFVLSATAEEANMQMIRPAQSYSDGVPQASNCSKEYAL